MSFIFIVILSINKLLRTLSNLAVSKPIFVVFV